MCALGVLIGVLGGFVGGCFAHLLSFVTKVRTAAPWLIFLLPLGGAATVLLYRVSRMSDYGGTNEMIHRLKHGQPLRVMAAPLIFLSTAITHLFGGSAGREGAAIQLGGTIASALSNRLRLKDNDCTAFMLSGMSAVFAGMFGTPLTAAFFVLEFRWTANVLGWAVVPCFLSAVVAKHISAFMGVAEEVCYLNHIPALTVPSVVKVIVLSVLLSLLGKGMCLVFHKSESWAKKRIANPLLRSVLGAAAIVALTVIVGDMRYNGSGMSMAIGAVNGNADWFDFLLKTVFTAITLAAGLKGGEIVPTFCIGATFGCVMGNVLDLDVGFAAALGLVGLFCCAANSPIGALFLGMELFGITALPYYLLVCLILWPLSVKQGLFDNRFFTPKTVCKTRGIIRQ